MADDPDFDDRPWERPGAVRRDCEPHRGDVLHTFGRVSLWLGALAIVLAIPALVALPLGVIIDVLAGRDLARMRAGEMDPGGQESVRLARWAAKWGTCSASSPSSSGGVC